MKRFSMLILALLAAACSLKEPAALEAFDPSEGVVFSDMSADKMAHCSIFKVVGDEVYFAYYHDTTQVAENPVINTIMPVLAKSPWPVTGDGIEYIDVVRCGSDCRA